MKNIIAIVFVVCAIALSTRAEVTNIAETAVFVKVKTEDTAKFISFVNATCGGDTNDSVAVRLSAWLHEKSVQTLKQAMDAWNSSERQAILSSLSTNDLSAIVE